MSATSRPGHAGLFPLSGLLLLWFLGGTSADEVTYIEASLEPSGELLETQFVDVDADGSLEVVLAVRDPAGSRELQVFRIDSSGVAPEPYRVVPVLDDAIAYGFADVRAEPGLELFFLTRSGAWSFSLEREGFRGNVARLAELELVYDVSDPEALPAWEYVLPRAGGDWLLLPGREGYTVWAPESGTGAEPARYRVRVEIAPPADTSDEPSRGQGGDRRGFRFGNGGGRGGGVHGWSSRELPEPFLAHAGGDARVFLSSTRAYRAPALLDVDGDGSLDLVTLDGADLTVRWGGSGDDDRGDLGGPDDRVETLPDYLPRAEVELELVDLDGDGDQDLLARVEEDVDGFENSEMKLFLLLNDGRRLLPQRPDQVLRFEAAELRVQVTDLDGDGRPDLSVRKFELPSLLGAVSGLEFSLTHLLYVGEDGPRPFARKPVLKQVHTFDETTIQEAIKNRVWGADCDGDGLADLIEVDLEGRITIRRLTRSTSFLGGSSWSLEETPWRRFLTFGSIEEVEARDLNGDGLGDIVSAGEEALTILLSARLSEQAGGGR